MVFCVSHPAAIFQPFATHHLHRNLPQGERFMMYLNSGQGIEISSLLIGNLIKVEKYNLSLTWKLLNYMCKRKGVIKQCLIDLNCLFQHSLRKKFYGIAKENMWHSWFSVGYKIFGINPIWKNVYKSLQCKVLCTHRLIDTYKY